MLFLVSTAFAAALQGACRQRKRWLSMHVYFGVSVLLSPPCTAACIGYNVYTLAYGLLCLVVISGCWGVYAYLLYPALMSRGRGGVGRDELLMKLAEVDRQARRRRELGTGGERLVADHRSSHAAGRRPVGTAARPRHSMLLLTPSARQDIREWSAIPGRWP